MIINLYFPCKERALENLVFTVWIYFLLISTTIFFKNARRNTTQKIMRITLGVNTCTSPKTRTSVLMRTIITVVQKLNRYVFDFFLKCPLNTIDGHRNIKNRYPKNTFPYSNAQNHISMPLHPLSGQINHQNYYFLFLKLIQATQCFRYSIRVPLHPARWPEK